MRLKLIAGVSGDGTSPEFEPEGAVRPGKMQYIFPACYCMGQCISEWLGPAGCVFHLTRDCLSLYEFSDQSHFDY